jgi:hypothetical protein
MFEEISKQATLWLAGGIELCAGVLIGLAAAQATIRTRLSNALTAACPEAW